jgi:hypothetical protein
MNGLLSPTPGATAVRLLLGSQLLLIVQAALIVRAASAVSDALWAISLAAMLMGLACLVSAVRGERPDPQRRVWRTSDGR